MTVDKVVHLLSKVGVYIEDKGNIIYHDTSYGKNYPLENHYAIRMSENGKWEYCFVQLERRNVPEYRPSITFNDKNLALTYFFLDRLRDYFMLNYIQDSANSNVKYWNNESLIAKFGYCNIPPKYFSYDNFKNINSIYCFKENEKWYNAFIGKKGNIVSKSPELENKNTAFLSTFRRINLLNLFDNYVEENLSEQKLEKPFTDIETAMFLKYNV